MIGILEEFDHVASHKAFCRTAITQRKMIDRKPGSAFVRWFFEGPSRRSRTWTSKQVARMTVSPVAKVWQSFDAARREGLVALREDGWEWVG